ncbi:MAG: KH domain-containing protein, partial [Promethearchaeota archaeon]
KDRYGRRFEIQCAQKDIPAILGKGGENIRMLERSFQVKLDVNKSDKDYTSSGMGIVKDNMISFRKKTLYISFPKRMSNKTIQFYTQDQLDRKKDPFFVGTTSKSGKIKLSTRNKAFANFKEILEINQIAIFWKLV